MTRAEILEAARKCVCQDRQGQYGEPEDNFQKIADLWTAWLGVTVLPEDVGIMMVLMKCARCVTAGTKADNYIDMAGYAACTGELVAARAKGATIK